MGHPSSPPSGCADDRLKQLLAIDRFRRAGPSNVPDPDSPNFEVSVGLTLRATSRGERFALAWSFVESLMPHVTNLRKDHWGQAAYNDDVAIAVVGAAIRSGRRVSDEVGVIGVYNTIPAADHDDPEMLLHRHLIEIEDVLLTRHAHAVLVPDEQATVEAAQSLMAALAVLEDGR